MADTREYSALRHYRDLVLHKAYADFRAESERTYLGVAWWVLEPLINMLIYYFVFGIFLGRGGENFIPYLITGLVVWRFFDATVAHATISITANMAMVQQVAFKKLIFPVISVIVCCYEFMFSLALLFVVLFIYGYGVTIYWLFFPVLLVYLLIFTLGLALPLAAIAPFVPDVLRLVQYSLRVAFYMSGVLYYIEDLPAKAQAILWFNPCLHVVKSFRDVLIYHRLPEFGPMILVSVLAFTGIGIGLYLHDRFNLYYAKRVTR